jgi:hypothetical protein
LASGNVTNRAFVFAKGVTIDETVMRGYWTFAIPVENSGNTPTREMDHLTVSSQTAPSDPEDIFVRTPKSAYDAPQIIPQRWGGSLLGPKAQTHLLGSQTGLPVTVVSKNGRGQAELLYQRRYPLQGRFRRYSGARHEILLRCNPFQGRDGNARQLR